MTTAKEAFIDWLEKLNEDQKREVLDAAFNHYIKPLNEGLFVGPYGTLKKGLFTGPAASSGGSSVCPTCKRPY